VSSALHRLIDNITVDAYDVSEQLTGFLESFLNNVEVPAEAKLLGVNLEVAGFDLEGDERRGLVAKCRHDEGSGSVSLADIRFQEESVAAWLHAANRTWLGLKPFPAREPSDWSLD
jgi:hypothetical protein